MHSTRNLLIAKMRVAARKRRSGEFGSGGLGSMGSGVLEPGGLGESESGG